MTDLSHLDGAAPDLMSREIAERRAQLSLDDVPRALVVDAAGALEAAEAGMEAARTAERVQAWRQSADAWLEEKPAGAIFVADELVADIGLPDEGVYRNNAVGAVFSSWAKRRKIVATGRRRRSARKIGHGNEQREWVKA